MPSTSTTTGHSRSRATTGARLTADERRADVIEVAVKAFASGGYAGTSTEEIARLAGVSQPYLFRLFGTKRDLFLAAVDRGFDRIADAFTAAAEGRTPGDHAPAHEAAGWPPILDAMGHAYGELVADRSLLRLQLHAFAACDDPRIREHVRGRFGALVNHVAELSGLDPASLEPFFATGMLMNVVAAMELTDARLAWDAICTGGAS